jgi:ribonuclease HI
MTRETGPGALIYTDGACIGGGRSRPGGFAALILIDGREQVILGRSVATTNTAMELLGAIEALEALPPAIPAVVHSDSQYVIKGVTVQLPWWRSRGWRIVKGGKLANRDLWQRLSLLLGERTVTWRWIKGHSGHPRNEQVHALAHREAHSAAAARIACS